MSTYNLDLLAAVATLTDRRAVDEYRVAKEPTLVVESRTVVKKKTPTSVVKDDDLAKAAWSIGLTSEIMAGLNCRVLRQ